jgi:YbbR domain-containing protein
VAFLPRILTKNWQLKVSAVGMAVLLWTVPRFEGQSSQILEDIPVRVQLSDPNWVLVGEPSPAVVTVTLSGPARDLIALGVDRPPVLVPMDDVSPGDTTVFLLHSWFRVSGRDGVVVEDLRPSAVSLSFERKEERHIPISVPVFGELPPGVSLAGPPVITPSVAQVFGAASRFGGVDSLRLMPLDLSLVQGPDPILLGVDTTGLQGLDVVSLEASVEIPTDSTTAREFPDQLLLLPLLDSDPQLQALPATVTVVLMGARSLVDGVDPDSLTVTIPTGRASLAPGQEERMGVVVEGVPEWVEVIVTPNWVRLRRPVGQ